MVDRLSRKIFDTMTNFCYVLAMPDVLDAPCADVSENVSGLLENVPAKRDYSHLKAYQFQKGAPKPGPGRPKGSKSFSTILTQAAPRIAKRYVKEALAGNASILTDARKVFVPTDADSVTPSTNVVIFAGQGALPRTFTESVPATTQMGISDAERPVDMAIAATLPSSAGTETAQDMSKCIINTKSSVAASPARVEGIEMQGGA